MLNGSHENFTLMALDTKMVMGLIYYWFPLMGNQLASCLRSCMSSNNEAKYEALIMGLELLITRGARNVDIVGDSQLVIRQMR